MMYSNLLMAVPLVLSGGNFSLAFTSTSHTSRALTSLYSAEPIAGLAVNIGELAERDTSAMERWATANGVQRFDGLKLRSADKYNQDVFAVTTQDVAAGTPVLSVPEPMIMSSNKAMQEFRSMYDMGPAEQILSSVEAESEIRQYYLMLKLLYELEQGTFSLFFPWLNSLPRYFENAVSMTSFCVSCLPSLMRKLNQKERGNQQSLSLWSIQKVPFLSDETKANEELVKWVYQIVYTRGFETPDGEDIKIVPMGDMFNHASDFVEVEPWYDEGGNYYAYTTYDIPAGSPLRMSYGDPFNPSFLMARYGFFDENSPATNCKLLPEKINQDMLDLGYSETSMLFYNTGEVSEEVWDILLYMHLSSLQDEGYTDKEALKEAHMDKRSLIDAHKAGDYETKQMLHQKYYQYTSARLLEHIDGFVEQLDKLLAKANTIGGNAVYVKNEHPRLPLIMKHNEFVKDAFLTVRSLYSPDNNWKDATRVMECNDEECAEALCVQDFNGEWNCEGGLGYNEDGSERATSKQVIL
eukprot:g13245.t1 g13245   contig8:244401-246138(-)